jgi:RNA polymerase sigma-70 factor (ECF subfamily)
VSTTKKTLLLRVRDPEDRTAWFEFFEIYAPMIASYARAHGLSGADADEVRDQCLEVLVRRMPGCEYRRSQGGFKGWLFRIAKGKIVDFLRRPSARRAETEELGRVEDQEPTPDELWEKHWRDEHLRYCLEEVRAKEPKRSFEAFELLLAEDLSVSEVCARLGMSPDQVYKAKSRVLKRVREILERLGTGAEPV